MDEKVSKIATKLITRSKTKTSKSHKKIVTMLNNLSKDKSGAPVKWKFNKSGVKQANKVGKKLKTAEEKELQTVTSSDSTDTDTVPKKVTKLEKSVDKNCDTKTSEYSVQKRKPGRPKLSKARKDSDLNAATSFVSVERLQDSELSGEINEKNTEAENTQVNETSSQNYSQTSKRGRRKKILSNNIRLKRLEILKRHIERGKGRGRGRIKRIHNLHSKLSSEKSSDCNSDEMEESSSVHINQDKLKLLKEQIDSERRRGRGRGNFRRGRGRWRDIPDGRQSIINRKTSVNSGNITDSDSTSKVENIVRPITSRGRRGRPPWKHISTEVRVHENIHTNSTTFIVSDKTWKRGRPPKRGRGARWTSLNRHALNKTALNEYTNINSNPLPVLNQVFDTIIDSESESVDSNLSNGSSKAKKRKVFHHLGIKLGPAKLLRSQDSMKTRKLKDSSGHGAPRKRKRTLSGEFDLLDEVSLRKQMRSKDDDDTSTVKSFDDSWADMTDSELNETHINTHNDNMHSDSENSSKLETKQKAKISNISSLQGMKKLHLESSKKKNIKVGRRRGRLPKMLTEEYEFNFRKNEKDLTTSNHALVSQNRHGRLTIIGPGGIQFIKIQSLKKPEIDITTSEKIADDYKKEFLANPEADMAVSEKSVEPHENSKLDKLANIDTVKSYNNIKTEGIKDESSEKCTNENTSADTESLSSVLHKESKTDTCTLDNSVTSSENKVEVNDKFTEEISQETILMSLKQVIDDKNKTVLPKRSPKHSGNLDVNRKCDLEGRDNSIPTVSSKQVESILQGKITYLERECEAEENTLPENSFEKKKNEKSENIEIKQINVYEETEEFSKVAEKHNAEDSSENIDKKTSAVDTLNEDENETGVTRIENDHVDFNKSVIINQYETTNVENEISAYQLIKKIDEITGDSVNENAFRENEITNDCVEEDEHYVIKECVILAEPESVVRDILGGIIDKICGKFETENIQKEHISIETKTSEITDFGGKIVPVTNTSTLSVDVNNVNKIKDNVNNTPCEMVTSGNEKTSKILEENINESDTKFEEDKKVEIDKKLDISDKAELVIISEKEDDIEIDEDKNVIKPETSEEITNDEHSDQSEITNKKCVEYVETSETKVENESTITGDVSNESTQLPSTSHLHVPQEIPVLVAETSEIHIKKKRKKESEYESCSGISDIQETSSSLTPDTMAKTENKRVFQLRKKASRSPLEIIAMKHSMEERQYMLEETQRAIRREEKQKKMFQNKLLRQTGEQLSPPKQTSEQMSPPKHLDIVQHVSPEKAEELPSEPIINQCKSCSVVLIDFVKYLKMSDHSDKHETECDDLSTTEDEHDEAITDTEGLSTVPIMDSKKEESNAQTTTSDKNHKQTESSEIIPQPEMLTPPVKKAVNKARKQAKSYNYSSKLTAEIVSSPEPIESCTKSFTVPPLRLKIKQKEKVKKRFKGHKWTAPRNKARKQMSPTKRMLSNQKFEFETLGSKDNVYDIEESNEKILRLDGMSDASNISTNATSDSVSIQSNVTQNVAGYGTGNISSEGIFRFKCSHKNCVFKSQTRNIMESHVYIHLKDIPFKCSHCDGIFESRNIAFNHSKTKHPDKETKIVTVDTVDESKFYEEINTPQRAENSNVIQADIADVHHSSESLIISVRLPRNINDSATSCFCCCHCEYSSSKIQDINTHVEENHRENIQYLCSVCNKAVYRHGEGIARHFSVEHPDQPVAYKSLADFYDVRKTIEKPPSGDKGNIFDRMSDLFSGGRSPDKGTKLISEKTSAEADSTTTDHDPVEESSNTAPVTSGVKKVVEPFHREPDGIEQLAQIFGPTTSAEDDKRESDNRNSTFEDKNNTVLEDSGGNDMGLKIVDVVSLQGGSDFAKNVWGDSAVVSKPTVSFQNQLPIQTTERPPVLVPSSTLRQNHFQMNRPILPMPQRLPFNSSNNIDAAKLKETTTTYKCEKCNVHAPVLSAIVEHLRNGHKDIPRLFLCPFCRQYEGATEPDIHKHIKQFHPSPDTRSPPVALSGDAKQHLRTIEVPVGDTQKVNGKYLIEKDIYKCLKCKRHMPSLDYIYEHLEKEHNEVFVYVCPDCKSFRAKEEEVVFNHIKTVHHKNTDDIILSLAIEENLFTRVQCLLKDKSAQNKGQLQKQIPPALSSPLNQVQQAHNLMAVSENRCQQIPVFPQRQPLQTTRPTMQPVFPGMIQNPPVRMPGPAQVPFPIHSQSSNRPPPPNQPMNKSAMRKSRPVHIPQQQNMDNNSSSNNMQHLPSEGQRLSSPPPLMRGPPPLIRFQGNHSTPKTSVQNSTIRSANFSMTDRVQRLHPHPHGQSMSSNVSPPPQNRPVLKVPSFPNRKTSAASPSSTEGHQTEEGAPLDLSRNSTPNSQADNSEDVEDMSPDAFQIFNIQPMRQQTPHVNPTHFSQMQAMPQQRHQTVGSYNPSAYNRQGVYNPIYRPPPPYSQHLGGHHSGATVTVNQQQLKPLKCPYCPHLVPLSMREVIPHIHKYHPGQKIQYIKKD